MNANSTKHVYNNTGIIMLALLAFFLSLNENVCSIYCMQ